MSNLPAIIKNMTADEQTVKSFCKRLITFYNDSGLSGAAGHSYIMHMVKYVQKKGIREQQLNLIYIWILENYPRQYRTAPGIEAIKRGYDATIHEMNKVGPIDKEDIEFVPELSGVLSSFMKMKEEGKSDDEIYQELLGGIDE